MDISPIQFPAKPRAVALSLRSSTRLVAWLWLAMAFIPHGARADDVSVAVAANFAAPMKRIAAEFEKDTGHRVLSALGSTGQFNAQIRNGAPFDILLAADDETPAKLVEDGAAVAGTQFTYAVGKLALWSARPGLVDAAGEVLRRGGFERIAIANPKLAPYGAAAVQTMRALGVLDALQPKLVTGENIAQTYQFIATGNAQLGFVALSQVFRNGEIAGGSAWVVARNLHEPIRQDAVILARGRGKPGAEAFVKFLRSDKARGIVRAFGYEL